MKEISRKYEGDYLFSIMVNGKKVPVYTEDVCLTRDNTKLIIGLSEGTQDAIAAARKRIVIDKSGGE